MAMPPVIEAIYAWVAEEPDQSEGIIAVKLTTSWAPLVGADRERIESFRDAAMHIHQTSMIPVRLLRFTTREILEDYPVTRQ
jgi:hypothetical protein